MVSSHDKTNAIRVPVAILVNRETGAGRGSVGGHDA